MSLFPLTSREATVVFHKSICNVSIHTTICNIQSAYNLQVAQPFSISVSGKSMGSGSRARFLCIVPRRLLFVECRTRRCRHDCTRSESRNSTFPDYAVHQPASISTEQSDATVEAAEGTGKVLVNIHSDCGLTGLSAGKSSSACHKVFNIFELAEAIFLELSMRDVLVNVQRTSRSWHDLIQASLPLQQALFYTPISASRLHFFTSPDCHGKKRRRWAEISHALTEPILVEHPLLAYDASARPFTNDYFDPDSPVNRAQASWRRQLVTQPPIAVAEFECGNGNHSKIVRSEVAGVRLCEISHTLQNINLGSIQGYALW